MNKIKSKFIALLIVGFGMSLFSCNDYLDVNVDPNQSTVSRIDLQLSAAQLLSSIGIGQRIFPRLGVWCQYHTGGPGVALGDPDQNKWAPSESNEIFRNAYRANNNLNYIIKNSTEEYYIAIAKIMMAYNFQVCADLFGDIPYKEALNGDITDGSILHPKYDDAKTVVYPGIEAELLDAIRRIEAGGAFLHPGADDLIYGGDLDKWNKFAHSLLLKVYLRQSESSDAAVVAAAQAGAMALYNNDDQFILTNDEAALMAFPGGSSASNPFWNAAKSTALGNFYVATTTMLDFLQNTNDPRLDYFYDKDKTGAHSALIPGDVQNAAANATFSTPNGALVTGGDLIFSPTAPVFFMSAWESQLLLAEAAARGWFTTPGSTVEGYYNAAVEANCDYLGVDPVDCATYLGDPNAGQIDPADWREYIAGQKWLCMNGTQPVESWIEIRRFDDASNSYFTSPGGIFVSPTQNALGVGVFPSILPYPENEESLNQNFPGPHPITSKVFWDN